MPKQTFFNLTSEKQKQIIDVAINEFSQSTFNEVKISDIISKAKIPRSSFYDYFEDKKDLYKYIILIIREEKMKYMEPALTEQQESFFERLRGLFKAGAEFAASKPEFEKLANKMFENMEIIYEIFGTEELDMSSAYESMLMKGVEAGEIRSDIDIKFIAKSIHILTSNLMLESFEGSKETLSEAIQKTTKNIINFIKFGIAK
ncbi:TetR/AcrR family transcriptional regulator [Alkaliphilus sp. MSJ-5]|uniref:TetR/AcrR family transcriptional regulator n=1 Tax=Alkaliphilus flagellatus TaxID=2841507 RepID=A0ABS6G1L4_9FIRM|nr:TetR/AcrR family transcriptional regulator [Alkaliphilus flagellatus]MBU5676371.1 TetR/AcrR family transcriptional regulator [Alkaliphilus flagellatus]